jgi:hypothetical protein
MFLDPVPTALISVFVGSMYKKPMLKNSQFSDFCYVDTDVFNYDLNKTVKNSQKLRDFLFVLHFPPKITIQKTQILYRH